MASNGEILRVVFNYLVPGASQVLNVFTWMIDTGNPTDTEVLDDMAEWAENVWGVNWADLAQSATELDLIDVDVVAADGTVVRNLGARAIGLVGLVGGETGVAAASGHIIADTVHPKTRGSKYIPGLGEGNLLNGVLTTESLVDLTLLLVDYVTDYRSETSDARYVPGVVARVLQEFVPFLEAGRVTDIPAYQRRRKPQVGS